MPEALLALLAMASIHVATPSLRFLGGIPRSVWLSTAGGASIAYVFLHLLPELSQRQQIIDETLAASPLILEQHIYALSLVGLGAFYGLERLAVTSRKGRRQQGEDRVSPLVFWIHSASFAAYNALIGYLMLHREDPSRLGLALFALAMGLHFIVADYGLLEQHKSDYRRIVRWVLAGALLAGWLIGSLTEVSPYILASLFAFLAGGVILNVLKEELPEERESRFSAFAVGALAYGALLLII